MSQTSRRPAAADGRGLGIALYDLLKQRLREGGYEAGEPISVEQLRAEYGVSKQPIMKALHQLDHEGLVTVLPQVGCRVATYSPQEVEDFFVMFGAFEGAIAATAATRRTTDQIARLWEICEATVELEALSDPQEVSRGYLRLNRDFHSTVHAMAHSTIMADQSSRMWDLSDFMIATAGQPFPLHSAIHDRHADHAHVLEAIEDQDPGRARQAMEAHIVGTLAIIRSGESEEHGTSG